MSADRPAPPTRRSPWSRRRALAVLVASGLALVGALTLVVVWAGIGLSTSRAQAAGTPACLAAVDDDGTARVRYQAVPARSTCTWQVDGRTQEVVVASAPTSVVVGALVLGVGGVVASTLLALPRRPSAAAAS